MASHTKAKCNFEKYIISNFCRRRPQNLSLDPLSDGIRDGLSLADRQAMLDPTAVLEIERHARYLVIKILTILLYVAVS